MCNQLTYPWINDLNFFDFFRLSCPKFVDQCPLFCGTRSNSERACWEQDKGESLVHAECWIRNFESVEINVNEVKAYRRWLITITNENEMWQPWRQEGEERTICNVWLTRPLTGGGERARWRTPEPTQVYQNILVYIRIDLLEKINWSSVVTCETRERDEIVVLRDAVSSLLGGRTRNAWWKQPKTEKKNAEGKFNSTSARTLAKCFVYIARMLGAWKVCGEGSRKGEKQLESKSVFTDDLSHDVSVRAASRIGRNGEKWRKQRKISFTSK